MKNVKFEIEISIVLTALNEQVRDPGMSCKVLVNKPIKKSFQINKRFVDRIANLTDSVSFYVFKIYVK